MKVKEESEKAGLKLNIQKIKIMASSPISSVQFSSVQSLSHVWLFATPWIAAHQASLSITISRSSPKLMSIALVMPSNHLIRVVPFSSCSQSLPASGSFPMSQFFTSGSQSISKSFSFSISPSNEHPGLISFRMDWLDLLVVQGTLKGLLQHHSSKTLEEVSFIFE